MNIDPDLTPDSERLTPSRVTRRLAYVVYILIAKHLPATNRGRLGRMAIRSLRRWCAERMFDFCGADVNVESGADFGKGRGISIGSRSGIGIRARIDEPVVIGNDVMMAPDVLIFTRNHRFSRLDIPMIEQGTTEPKLVTIGNDVWIGERVMLLPGVTIGDGAIIGAGAVVRTNIPPLAIAVGNPAVVIDYRKDRRDTRLV